LGIGGAFFPDPDPCVVSIEEEDEEEEEEEEEGEEERYFSMKRHLSRAGEGSRPESSIRTS